MIYTKIAMVLAFSWLTYWFVVRPIVAKWNETDGDIWKRGGNLWRTVAARIASIWVFVAPMIADALGQIDLATLMQNSPWLVPIAGVVLCMIIDVLKPKAEA